MEPGADNKTGSGQEQRQYIAFRLADELFGVNVMKAQEVMSIIPVDHVPDTQPYMKGVIDLRGRIVPVVDLRTKYGIEEKTYNDDTAIMITEIHNELVGLIVDAVVDVLILTIEDVQHTPHFTTKMDRDSVDGIGKVNNEIIIILDVDRILTAQELKGLAASNA